MEEPLVWQVDISARAVHIHANRHEGGVRAFREAAHRQLAGLRLLEVLSFDGLQLLRKDWSNEYYVLCRVEPAGDVWVGGWKR